MIRRAAPLALLLAAPAVAGPPYFTDDPQPTDLGHWELYAFASGTRIAGTTAGAAGLDINYGGMKDLQLTAVVPLEYERGRDAATGLGNIEVAAKYKFLHQSDGTLLPDIAFFPRLFMPTAGRRFGSGRLGVLLPLWAEKDFGPWSVFGGGGWQLNPGAGNRNFWLQGLAVTRAVTKRLALGIEVSHFGPDAEDARPFTALAVGATWRLNPHYSLIGSFGPGIENARRQGRTSFYIALKADY